MLQRLRRYIPFCSGRADISFQTMVEMDVEYLQTRSILTDIGILARTPLAVITARGAY